jgi:DNA-binding NarL/FixJ family response regulator
VTTVLVADDQVLVRAGFRLILEAEGDLEVVAEAGDGQAAVDLAAALRPDVCLMDVRMPRLDGIGATREITRASPSARVLVLTTFDLDEYVYDALQAGASGFLLKDAPPDQLRDAVRRTAAGDALVASPVVRRLIGHYLASGRPGRRSALLDALTERERTVLGELAKGWSNAEIADALHLGEGTVKTHVTHVLAKLGLRDRVQAVVFAYESGFVRPSG